MWGRMSVLLLIGAVASAYLAGRWIERYFCGCDE
jgi:hypothetical protein